MSVQATNKFQSFTDLDGNPLNNGYIYIGTSGYNPETTPISIYSDADLTIPAAQPLRTSGGYIVINGSPSNIYTSGDYSITVRDSDESLVYASFANNIEPAQNIAAQALAEASTTAGQLPTLAPGDENKILTVNAAEDGYDLDIISDVAVDLSSAQTVAGVKTFSSFPVTPSSAPTTDYQASNKKYVDDSIVSGLTNITSGTYTPTLTSVTNVSSSSASNSRYIRVGNVVHCSVIIAVTPTSSGGTLTEIGISLPISSNLTSNTLSGVGNAQYSSSAMVPGLVSTDSTNDRATFLFNAQSTGTNACRVEFSYEIL